MTFVTGLTLQSGDRAALEGVVEDIKRTAERKGVALKGPHSHPPKHLRVPQYRRLHADDERRGDAWSYTVFTRDLEIYGYQEFARDVAGRDLPDSVRIEVSIEQIHGKGRA